MTERQAGHPVIVAARTLRAQLLANEQEVANRLVAAYGRSYARLSNQIEALQERLAVGEEISRAQAANLSTLRNLRAEIIREMDRFAVYADQEIQTQAYQAVSRAIQDSQTLVQANYLSAEAQQAITASYRLLPTEQVVAIIERTGAQSPLRASLVDRFGTVIADMVADALVDGIAQGKNPREVAGIIRREMGMGLTDALRTARTAQLYSYRQATSINFLANSDIVEGWRWWASLDGRVCLSCVSKHNTIHRVDETLNDHHNGRCTQLPIVTLPGGAGALPTQTGEEWFNELAEGEQVSRMGPAMYSAWRAGEFQFSDLSVPYQDRIYGEMLREASLIGLIGDRARDYYR